MESNNANLSLKNHFILSKIVPSIFLYFEIFEIISSFDILIKFLPMQSSKTCVVTNPKEKLKNELLTSYSFVLG